MGGKLKISEIARQTGLSVSTVSRVLAGKANTSDSARQRVLACARSQGILSGMSAGRLLLNSLVVFAPSRAFDVRSDVFYYKVIQGISQALEPHEVRLRYCGLEEFDCDAGLFLEKITDPATEAAIIVGIDDPRIHTLAADIGKPCVLINCRDRSMRLPGVSPDHQLIGEFSAQYLFSQGHKNILAALCLRRYTMELRLEGIRSAFQQHNQRFDEAHHLLTTQGFGAAEAEQAFSAWLQQHPSTQWPSVILAGGDYMAAGIVSALRNAGLRIPHDISVMSMDGFNLAAIHDIPLTSVHVPRDELGEEAVRLLQQRLMRPEMTPGNLLLHGKLAIRDSVRRIGAHKTPLPEKAFGLYD